MENLFGVKKRGRPKKNKKVKLISKLESFGPLFVDVEGLEKVKLSKEEFEAIRLKNIEGYDILNAGKLMGVGKSTFANIYNSAIQKLSEAIVVGKIIEFN